MSAVVYSRWDGSQEAFSLDAQQALDALSDLMMEGMSAAEALEWMRQYGFELAGMDFRVMGLEEMAAELRDEIRSLEQKYRLDQAQDELRRRFDDILRREQDALREQHGYESARMNDFQERRHADTSRLSEAVDQFRDYRFEDEEAGDEFRELETKLQSLISEAPVHA